jgi:hypothetical protein
MTAIILTATGKGATPQRSDRRTDTHLVGLRCAQWPLYALPRLNGELILNVVVFSVSCSLSSIYHGVNFYGDTCGSDAQSDRPYNAWVAMPGSTPESLGRADDCTDCFFIKTCLASCNETLSAPEMIDLYPTTKFGYFCVPDTDAFVQGEVHVEFSYSGDFATVQQNAARAMGDLYTTWPLILGCAAVALLFSFLYNKLSETFAGVLVSAELLPPLFSLAVHFHVGSASCVLTVFLPFACVSVFLSFGV